MRVLTHMDLGAFAFWIIVYPTYWRETQGRLPGDDAGGIIKSSGFSWVDLHRPDPYDLASGYLHIDSQHDIRFAQYFFFFLRGVVCSVQLCFFREKKVGMI